MAEDDADLAEITFGFLAGLPDTIRTDVLLFVVLYATDDDSAMAAGVEDTGAALRDQLETLLLKRGGMPLVSALLRVVAVTDHVLARSEIKSRSAEPIMKMLAQKNPTFDRTVMGLALRQRHTSKALADWKALRATTITAQTLRDFEDTALMPRHLR